MPDPFLERSLVGGSKFLLLLLAETGPVNHMPKFMDQDTLYLHSTLELQDILFGKKHRGTSGLPGEKPPAPPVIEVELLPRLIGRELRHLRGHFVMSNKNTQHLALPDPLRNFRDDTLHHHLELVGRLQMCRITHLL